MISVKINDKQHSFAGKTSLLEVIQLFDLNKSGTAIAVNEEIVKKSDWKTKEIKNKDKILIIQATQGG